MTLQGKNVLQPPVCYINHCPPIAIGKQQPNESSVSTPSPVPSSVPSAGQATAGRNNHAHVL